MTTDEFIQAGERSANLERAIGLSVPMSIMRAVYTNRARNDNQLADAIITTFTLGGSKAVVALYETFVAEEEEA